MPGLLVALVVVALVSTVVSAFGKCPPWVPLFVVVVILMIMVWPK